ncbi:MAG: ribosome-associated translation inhibitor RaiA [Pseudomonadales bacterium]|nr:ribosome-associated translation inhibitor RaiA [Pseudomonadales bacterium]
MTVIVESKRMKVTSALRSFIEKQTRKLVKLNKNATQVRVHLETVEKKSNDPLSNMVTFLIEIPGKNIVITKRAVNMYDAIVDATSGAVRQLRKHYERKQTVYRKHKVEADADLVDADPAVM